MAIDYIVDYACVPKQVLTTVGILERIKGRERAEAIIALFRESGDDRPPSEMGFEFTRSTPDGEDERRVMHVQTLLDAAEELKPLENHCQGCPANRTGEPYGCIGFIQYPITRAGEKWLIDRLPTPDDPLIWLLLKQGIKEFSYDGSSIKPLRGDAGNYFEDPFALVRKLGEFEIDANQVLEMMFSVGHISPNHAALLLLFFHAIDRNLEADEIMSIAPAAADVRQQHPFKLEYDDEDKPRINELKAFFQALYVAWTINARLLVDA